MSRWIEVDDAKQFVRESIVSMDECKMMCNGTCCHPKSDNVGERVATEYCVNRCPQFEQEDGVIIGLHKNTETL